MPHPLKNLARLAALTLFLAAPALAVAQERTITVTGEASVQARPDVAVIELGVTQEAGTAKAAFDAAAAAMRKVTEALAAAGVAERDRQTSTISIFPRYAESAPGMAPSVAGYSARSTVTIRARTIGDTGSLLDAATAAGANEIGGISFSVGNDGALRDEARVGAVKEARRKAELFAGAAGVELGDVVTIAEQGDNPPMRPMMKFAAAADSGMPVEPGEIEIAESITVTFALLGRE